METQNQFTLKITGLKNTIDQNENTIAAHIQSISELKNNKANDDIKRQNEESAAKKMAEATLKGT